MLWNCPTVRRPQKRPEKAGEIISPNHLPECLTDLSEVLEEVSGERAV